MSPLAGTRFLRSTHCVAVATVGPAIGEYPRNSRLIDRQGTSPRAILLLWCSRASDSADAWSIASWRAEMSNGAIVSNILRVILVAGLALLPACSDESYDQVEAMTDVLTGKQAIDEWTDVQDELHYLRDQRENSIRGILDSDE